MRKTLTAIAAAATLALASVATPQPAQARHGRNAAAIIGGLAAGALLGAAVGQWSLLLRPRLLLWPAAARYYYRPHCWWSRERYWNGYRWRWHRVRVCD